MAKAAKTKGKDDKKKGAKPSKPVAKGKVPTKVPTKAPAKIPAKVPAKVQAKAPAKSAKPAAKAPAKPAPKAPAKPAAKAPGKAALPVKPAVKTPVKAAPKAAAKPAPKVPAKPAAKPATKPVAKPAPKVPAKPAKADPKAAAKAAKPAAPVKPAVAATPAKAAPKAAPAAVVAKPAAPGKAAAAKAAAPAKVEPPRVEFLKPEPRKVQTGVKLQPVRQINPLEPPANPNALIHGQKPYIAAAGEKYMSGGQLDHFRRILQAWKQELMEEVDRTVHHMQDESANLPDPNDRATQEEEFALELRTRDRERKLIKKIDKTLSIIGDGDYGFCEACGIEIGIRRLEARPTAELCIDCKTLAEIKEKQVGSGN